MPGKEISMKKKILIPAIVCFVFGLIFNTGPAALRAETVFITIGLGQSDIQYQAVMGLSGWAKQGPRAQLRAVFSIHREAVCLVAAADAGIKTMANLKGKRINLPNPGSGQYQNAIDALRAMGLNPQSDIEVEKVKASEAPVLLQDNRIDAFFCTVGHPSETLQNATSGKRKVRFIPAR